RLKQMLCILGKNCDFISEPLATAENSGSLLTKDTTRTASMATQEASGDDVCPFCQIADKQTNTEILFSQDEELLCFRDVKPGAETHFLVVTRRHIDNCRMLQTQHIPLVERMVEVARSVLEENKVHNSEDNRMGFHLPPFTSVPHLHLHVLCPASKMNVRAQLRYGPQSHWFITVNKVLSQLKTSGKVK
uniref:HIT domain-containing protein n=1 Tax=Tetraodon nigroviridis TaxID=99883 RepID=H3DG20_TETNG